MCVGDIFTLEVFISFLEVVEFVSAKLTILINVIIFFLQNNNNNINTTGTYCASWVFIIFRYVVKLPNTC